MTTTTLGLMGVSRGVIPLSSPSPNVPPVLADIEGSELAFAEGDGPTAITSAITVADSDDSSIDSAEVEISDGYINGEDVLAFVDANGITGSWNASTGILSLSGSATKANYQTALRSITFDTDYTAVGGTREISFTINDGDDDSNTVARDIAVSGSRTSANTGFNNQLADTDYLGIWQMTEESGTAIKDYSTFNNEGTLSSGTLAQPGPTSYLANALEVDGTEDVTIADSDDFVTGNQFTVSLWIYCDTLTACGLFSKATSATAGEWYVFLDTSGRVTFRVVDDSAGAYKGRVTSSDSIVTGQWQKITCYYNNGTMSIYVDEVRRDGADTTSGTFTAIENTTAPITIGSRGNATYYTGRMSNAVFYDGLATHEQLRFLDYGNISAAQGIPAASPLREVCREACR